MVICYTAQKIITLLPLIPSNICSQSSSQRILLICKHVIWNLPAASSTQRKSLSLYHYSQDYKMCPCFSHLIYCFLTAQFIILALLSTLQHTRHPLWALVRVPCVWTTLPSFIIKDLSFSFCPSLLKCHSQRGLPWSFYKKLQYPSHPIILYHSFLLFFSP